jgi:transposase-like protein
MRHTPAAIQQFLIEQSLGGQTVADFCYDYDLKVPTFYSWKRKYKETQVEPQDGFYKITPRQEISKRSLQLPSGLSLELTGLSITEIAELVLEIDRAHA